MKIFLYFLFGESAIISEYWLEKNFLEKKIDISDCLLMKALIVKLYVQVNSSLSSLLICYVLQDPLHYRLHCEDMIESALAGEDFKDRTMM